MEYGVIEREAKVINSLGLHARPAAQLVKEGVPVNGKSIMGVMMLAAECGSTITVRANGVDAEMAMAAIVNLIATGFGET